MMLSSPRRVFLFLVVTFLITLSCSKKNNSSGGGGGGGPVTPPTPVWDPNALRGVWVTTTASTALDSRDNIKQLVATCKTAGINNLFIVVYNNARTIYPSPVMNALIGVSQLERLAGRDPLQECIDEGHAAGMKVHAWFEYGFSSSYSAAGGPIVAAKPQWAAKDINGNLVVKNGFDWLNAIHPEVQQFIIDLFKEVISSHPGLDGVQGDDRLPAMPSAGGYDAYTTTLYQAENSGTLPPASATEAGWLQWRSKKLNAFLKRLRTEVKTVRPSIQFSMSPSPYPFGYTEYLQDWPLWVDSAYIDAVMPQCYRYDISSYTNTVEQQKTYYRNSAVPFYPGVLVKSGTTIPSLSRQTGEMVSRGSASFFTKG